MGNPHVLIIKSVEAVTNDDGGLAIDFSYDISIECPAVTDACAEWVECAVAGCTVPHEYNHGARDALGHGVEHRWFREPSIWGVRSGFCFALNHGHAAGEELAERLHLHTGRYEVEPEFEDGSLQGFALVTDQEAGVINE